MTLRRTGFLYDPACLRHDPGHGHPERSARLAATMERLEREPWFGELAPVAAEPCPIEWLESVHAPEYIARAAKVCRAGGPYLDVPDVGVSRDSFDVARIAAGAGLALADRLMAGEIDNGFSPRPPGHHAEHAVALGSACSTTPPSSPAISSAGTVLRRSWCSTGTYTTETAPSTRSRRTRPSST